jgi:hypothetical protein
MCRKLYFGTLKDVKVCVAMTTLYHYFIHLVTKHIFVRVWATGQICCHTWKAHKLQATSFGGLFCEELNVEAE